MTTFEQINAKPFSHGIHHFDCSPFCFFIIQIAYISASFFF